jgi:hypothetical protein
VLPEADLVLPKKKEKKARENTPSQEVLLPGDIACSCDLIGLEYAQKPHKCCL